MKKAKNKSNIEIVKGYLAGERPFSQLGWTPDLIERKDGETWVDPRGKSWIQKDGMKKRVNTSLKIHPDSTRQTCNICKMDVKWGTHLDAKIYPKTGRCYDCNISFEAKLKFEGKFNNYEKEKIFKNQKGFCLDLKSKLEETIYHLENSTDDIVYINEDGSRETWKDTTKSTVLEDAKNDYKECISALERIECALKALSNNERV